MFGFNPRSNPYYTSNARNPYWGFDPTPTFVDSDLEAQRARARRQALQDARIRAAQQNPFMNPFGFHYPYEPSYYHDDEEDLYDRSQQSYLENQRRKQAYDEELRRRRLAQEELQADQLEAENARLQAQQKPQRRRRQSSPHNIPVSGPDMDQESYSIPVRQAPPLKPTRPVVPPRSQEELDEAATRIQNAWQRHTALQHIKAIEDQYASLKSSFVFPASLDFVSDTHPSMPTSQSDNIISLGTSTWVEPPPQTTNEEDPTTSKAKLSYTKTNTPLHAYVDSLSRLLVQLDEVESHGKLQIRERRKAAVQAIEKEAQDVDNRWRGVWESHLQSQMMMEKSKEVSTTPSHDVVNDTETEGSTAFVSAPETPTLQPEDATEINDDSGDWEGATTAEEPDFDDDGIAIPVNVS